PQKNKHKNVASDKKNKYPVLYLLHGLTDNHSSWQRFSSIERYAQEKGLAVVMPNVHRSFYTNMEKGYNYWSFLDEELQEVVVDFFNISKKRKDNFVAGLSMGGYGSFKWALRRPEKFAAAASFSGALNLARRVYDFKDKQDRIDEFELIYGDIDSIKNSKNDIFYLLKNLKNYNGEIPKLYAYIGKDDFLYEDNITFKKLCKREKIELFFEEDKGGHEWEFWDKKILDFISRITLKNE
ncbi:MAG: alpha/beta hydrolase, partial [archaeon]